MNAALASTTRVLQGLLYFTPLWLFDSVEGTLIKTAAE